MSQPDTISDAEVITRIKSCVAAHASLSKLRTHCETTWGLSSLVPDAVEKRIRKEKADSFASLRDPSSILFKGDQTAVTRPSQAHQHP